MTEQQQKTVDNINEMEHETMCSLWRNAPSGHPYFDKRLPFHEIFKDRLFKHFGGFTPQISKSIG